MLGSGFISLKLQSPDSQRLWVYPTTAAAKVRVRNSDNNYGKYLELLPFTKLFLMKKIIQNLKGKHIAISLSPLPFLSHTHNHTHVHVYTRSQQTYTDPHARMHTQSNTHTWIHAHMDAHTTVIARVRTSLAVKILFEEEAFMKTGLEANICPFFFFLFSLSLLLLQMLRYTHTNC